MSFKPLSFATLRCAAGRTKRSCQVCSKPLPNHGPRKTMMCHSCCSRKLMVDLAQKRKHLACLNLVRSEVSK
jgi:hypothetical protein